MTNHPLAVCDFSTLDVEEDILHMAGSYGTAYGVSASRESFAETILALRGPVRVGVTSLTRLDRGWGMAQRGNGGATSRT